MHWRHFLRQTSLDPTTSGFDLRSDLAALAELGASVTAERVTLLGRIGESCRMLGMLDSALGYLGEAWRLAIELGDRRAEAVIGLRYATALQHRDRHDEALALFETSLALVREHAPDLEDYAHQHLGKCLVEMGAIPRARVHFERALSLREAKGDAALLRSTREALDTLALGETLGEYIDRIQPARWMATST